MTPRPAPEYSAEPVRTAEPRRTPEPVRTAEPRRPVGRAVVAGLVLAVGAGAAWVAGMIYTIAGWSG